ncbi:hypothetical protein SEA_GOURDTHYMES_74 [Gordonia phage GourdThymes]|uniref:Uncharacterized protein n=1 Tax=Gordonia phage Hotorobo TaxID=1821554 RepID=A0A142K8D3_9CAUD|nr:hypothetical protein BJD64_gp059 [Gordonia phage Hotorobo]AMS02366.1 hypothetical protein SEA_HOTOROBO_74 [Gordonia phage Hotorobo]QOP64727.1 hypothetical protein SEA_GOURDTHYMES_74 [Gordonia phage GourdThymes]WGH19756.1 hypothetical protein [Gordonia phage Lizzo]
MTYPTWPEVYPTLNQPDHEHHLDWTFECGAPGCRWMTYHRSKEGARTEKKRHHDNDQCPYLGPVYTIGEEGRLVARGPSILEKMWDELDRVTKGIMEQRPRFKNDEMTAEELEGYFKLQGQAMGLAIAIQMTSVPHFANVGEVSKWSLKRYRMNTGEIDFMDTPGCQGYNPMPPPSREIKSARPQPKASSPASDPKTGKFKALNDDERQHLINMHGKGIPAGPIMGMLKISQEQYDHEISKL